MIPSSQSITQSTSRRFPVFYTDSHGNKTLNKDFSTFILNSQFKNLIILSFVGPAGRGKSTVASIVGRYLEKQSEGDYTNTTELIFPNSEYSLSKTRDMDCYAKLLSLPNDPNTCVLLLDIQGLDSLMESQEEDNQLSLVKNVFIGMIASSVVVYVLDIRNLGEDGENFMALEEMFEQVDKAHYEIPALIFLRNKVRKAKSHLEKHEMAILQNDLKTNLIRNFDLIIFNDYGESIETVDIQVLDYYQMSLNSIINFIGRFPKKMKGISICPTSFISLLTDLISEVNAIKNKSHLRYISNSLPKMILVKIKYEYKEIKEYCKNRVKEIYREHRDEIRATKVDDFEACIRKFLSDDNRIALNESYEKINSKAYSRYSRKVGLFISQESEKYFLAHSVSLIQGNVNVYKENLQAKEEELSDILKKNRENFQNELEYVNSISFLSEEKKEYQSKIIKCQAECSKLVEEHSQVQIAMQKRNELQKIVEQTKILEDSKQEMKMTIEKLITDIAKSKEELSKTEDDIEFLRRKLQYYISSADNFEDIEWKQQKLEEDEKYLQIIQKHYQKNAEQLSQTSAQLQSINIKLAEKKKEIQLQEKEDKELTKENKELSNDIQLIMSSIQNYSKFSEQSDYITLIDKHTQLSLEIKKTKLSHAKLGNQLQEIQKDFDKLKAVVNLNEIPSKKEYIKMHEGVKYSDYLQMINQSNIKLGDLEQKNLQLKNLLVRLESQKSEIENKDESEYNRIMRKSRKYHIKIQHIENEMKSYVSEDDCQWKLTQLNEILKIKEETDLKIKSKREEIERIEEEIKQQDQRIADQEKKMSKDELEKELNHKEIDYKAKESAFQDFKGLIQLKMKTCSYIYNEFYLMIIEYASKLLKSNSFFKSYTTKIRVNAYFQQFTYFLCHIINIDNALACKVLEETEKNFSNFYQDCFTAFKAHKQFDYLVKNYQELDTILETDNDFIKDKQWNDEHMYISLCKFLKESNKSIEQDIVDVDPYKCDTVEVPPENNSQLFSFFTRYNGVNGTLIDEQEFSAYYASMVETIEKNETRYSHAGGVSKKVLKLDDLCITFIMEILKSGNKEIISYLNSKKEFRKIINSFYLLSEPYFRSLFNYSAGEVIELPFIIRYEGVHFVNYEIIDLLFSQNYLKICSLQLFSFTENSAMQEKLILKTEFINRTFSTNFCEKANTRVLSSQFKILHLCGEYSSLLFNFCSVIDINHIENYISTFDVFFLFVDSNKYPEFEQAYRLYLANKQYKLYFVVLYEMCDYNTMEKFISLVSDNPMMVLIELGQDVAVIPKINASISFKQLNTGVAQFVMFMNNLKEKDNIKSLYSEILNNTNQLLAVDEHERITLSKDKFPLVYPHALKKINPTAANKSILTYLRCLAHSNLGLLTKYSFSIGNNYNHRQNISTSLSLKYMIRELVYYRNPSNSNEKSDTNENGIEHDIIREMVSYNMNLEVVDMTSNVFILKYLKPHLQEFMKRNMFIVTLIGKYEDVSEVAKRFCVCSADLDILPYESVHGKLVSTEGSELSSDYILLMSYYTKDDDVEETTLTKTIHFLFEVSDMVIVTSDISKSPKLNSAFVQACRNYTRFIYKNLNEPNKPKVPIAFTDSTVPSLLATHHITNSFYQNSVPYTNLVSSSHAIEKLLFENLKLKQFHTFEYWIDSSFFIHNEIFKSSSNETSNRKNKNDMNSKNNSIEKIFNNILSKVSQEIENQKTEVKGMLNFLTTEDLISYPVVIQEELNMIKENALISLNNQLSAKFSNIEMSNQEKLQVEDLKRKISTMVGCNHFDLQNSFFQNFHKESENIVAQEMGTYLSTLKMSSNEKKNLININTNGYMVIKCTLENLRKAFEIEPFMKNLLFKFLAISNLEMRGLPVIDSKDFSRIILKMIENDFPLLAFDQNQSVDEKSFVENLQSLNKRYFCKQVIEKINPPRKVEFEKLGVQWSRIVEDLKEIFESKKIGNHENLLQTMKRQNYTYDCEKHIEVFVKALNVEFHQMGWHVNESFTHKIFTASKLKKDEVLLAALEDIVKDIKSDCVLKDFPKPGPFAFTYMNPVQQKDYEQYEASKVDSELKTFLDWLFFNHPVDNIDRKMNQIFTSQKILDMKAVVKEIENLVALTFGIKQHSLEDFFSLGENIINSYMSDTPNFSNDIINETLLNLNVKSLEDNVLNELIEQINQNVISLLDESYSSIKLQMTANFKYMIYHYLSKTVSRLCYLIFNFKFIIIVETSYLKFEDTIQKHIRSINKGDSLSIAEDSSKLLIEKFSEDTMLQLKSKAIEQFNKKVRTYTQANGDKTIQDRVNACEYSILKGVELSNDEKIFYLKYALFDEYDESSDKEMNKFREFLESAKEECVFTYNESLRELTSEVYAILEKMTMEYLVKNDDKMRMARMISMGSLGINTQEEEQQIQKLARETFVTVMKNLDKSLNKPQDSQIFDGLIFDLDKFKLLLKDKMQNLTKNDSDFIDTKDAYKFFYQNYFGCKRRCPCCKRKCEELHTDQFIHKSKFHNVRIIERYKLSEYPSIIPCDLVTNSSIAVINGRKKKWSMEKEEIKQTEKWEFVHPNYSFEEISQRMAFLNNFWEIYETEIWNKIQFNDNKDKFKMITFTKFIEDGCNKNHIVILTDQFADFPQFFTNTFESKYKFNPYLANSLRFTICGLCDENFGEQSQSMICREELARNITQTVLIQKISRLGSNDNIVKYDLNSYLSALLASKSNHPYFASHIVIYSSFTKEILNNFAVDKANEVKFYLTCPGDKKMSYIMFVERLKEKQYEFSEEEIKLEDEIILINEVLKKEK